MNQTKSPITQSGKLKIEKELNQLIKVDREEIKKAIQQARELGDLKENAEYHSAKERQSLIEGRIQELQSILLNGQIVDVNQISSENIVFGATVKLYDIEKEASSTIQIVGKDESDSKRNLISYTSPLGKALIGKSVGDTVIVRAPKGDIEYEVEDVEYKEYDN